MSADLDFEKSATILAANVRRHIVKMVYSAKSGHIGGSLSSTDLMAVLYSKYLKHDPENPNWNDRDRFIMSKGHCTPVQYAILAERGYFPVDELTTFRQKGTRLQGHSVLGKPPGVENSAGALGMGLSFGLGIRLAQKLKGMQNSKVWVLMGDGEQNEGQVWEAAMSASHHGLDNLVAIVDRNRIQNDRWTHEVMSLEPFADKWKSFGWHSIEVDGHSIGELLSAFDKAEQTKGRPSVIIANTMKGKGVSFMENNVDFHGKAPSPDELAKALDELGE